MSIHIDEQALQTAARDMLKLRDRNEALRQRLEQMYKDITTARLSLQAKMFCLNQ